MAEKSAAFKVTVAYKDKEKVMDPNIWPFGAEVRDWFLHVSSVLLSCACFIICT